MIKLFEIEKLKLNCYIEHGMITFVTSFKASQTMRVTRLGYYHLFSPRTFEQDNKL